MSQIFSLGAVAPRRVLLALVGVLLVSLPFVATPAAGKPKPQAPFKLLASITPDRANPAPLANRKVAAPVYVFIAPSEGIRRVRYLVDGKPVGNRKGFDTARLAHGGHTAEAEIRLKSGRTARVRATFTVEHLFVAPTGARDGRCVKSRPCASFDLAYDLAQSGQTVEVTAGTYADQEIDGTRSPPKVIFQPAEGATVSIGSVSIKADHLELRNLKIGGLATLAEADNVTARNLDLGIFGIYGSSNVSIIGGDAGPSYNPGGHSFVNYISYGGPDSARVAPRNIVIDRVLFHDFRRGTPDDHMECLQVIGGDGITIRNSRFVRCDIFNILFTQWAGPAPPKNILIENNFFDKPTLDGGYEACCAYYALNFSDHMERFENIMLRYNSAAGGEFGMGQNPKKNVSFIANVGARGSCPKDFTFAYNVWDSRKCGTTDRIDRNPFVDPAKSNLHLRPGSAAINAGDPKSFPRRDIDGQARPLGKRPDAGADEAR